MNPSRGKLRVFQVWGIGLCFVLSIGFDTNAEGLHSPLRTLNGETILSFGELGGMEFTPNGKYLGILDDSRNLYLIDVDTSRIEKIINCDLEFDYSSSILFSPNSRYAIIQNDPNGSGRIIDLEDEKIVHLFQDTIYPFTPFTNDSQWCFFSTISDNQTHFFNLQTKEEKLLPRINAQLLDPTNEYFVGIVPEEADIEGSTQSLPIYLNYWNISDGSLFKSVILKGAQYYYGLGVNSSIKFVSFMDNENIIFCIVRFYDKWGGFRYTPYVWNTNTGEKLSHYTDFYDSQEPNYFEISLDKRWIAFFSQTAYPIFYDLTDYESANDFSFTLKKNIDHGAFYPNSNQILYRERSKDYSWTYYFLRTMDLETKTVLDEICLRQGEYRESAFSPDNQTLLFNHGYNFDIWDLSTPQFTKEIEDQANGYGTTIFTPDGRYLFRGSGDAYYGPISTEPIDITLIEGYGSYVDVYDPQTWSKVTRIQASEDDYRCFVNVSSGNLFLTASGNQLNPGTENLIRVWNTDTWDMVREIHGHRNSVWYAAFSPDDQRIVSASLDGTAKVWDVETGAMISEFDEHIPGTEYASVTFAEFLPDGQRVLSVGKDRRAFIWDADTAAVEKKFENLRLPVQLSPDGKYLFAGSEVWELASGQKIKTLDGISQDYTNLTLSPDGTLLLTCENTSLTKLWNVQEHILGGSGIRGFQTY